MLHGTCKSFGSDQGDAVFTVFTNVLVGDLCRYVYCSWSCLAHGGVTPAASADEFCRTGGDAAHFGVLPAFEVLLLLVS